MSITAQRTHPVACFAAVAGARLADLSDVPTWSMTPAEQRQALLDLARLRSQVDALYLRVMAEADHSGATDVSGATSPAEYVAAETKQTHRAARADLALARALDSHPHLDAALGETVIPEQARAIVKGIAQLPDEIASDDRDRAEAHLVSLAKDHDAAELARLGRRLVEVIAPQEADRIEGELLAKQEAAALRKVSLTMVDDGEGTVHGWFRIPTLHGAILDKLLLALTPIAGDDRPPAPVARGLAFCDLLERIPVNGLPDQAGANAAVVVTMTLDQLEGRLGAVGLDTGHQISAGEARRLACTAGVIPAVLGSRSQVLDLGRRTRFHTKPQRLAMTIRDGGCTADGCPRPPALCHAHHDKPWAEGGGTSVEDGRLLCGHHHRRIHDPAYLTTRLPNGKVAFHRRE